MDWHDWHQKYDEPGSHLGRRLAIVQERVREALDTAPPGPLRAVSVCAGQGRDLVEVLATHPRRADVTALLVELDPRNAEFARRTAAEAGLDGVRVVVGDASRTDLYADAVPAQLVLICGVFGNIVDADVRRVVDHCDQLCAPGGTLVWTRHRKDPDLVPSVCAWLEERGFERVWLAERGGELGVAGVGVHRFTGTSRPLARGERMFTFVGYDTLRRPAADA
ncbi:hypothetical protein OK074_3222 [Actinobacteria bacterium OK074]|nr:hypothetical protein OK074_3222 [Actinobacteria bacterium OK074]